jgi:methionyl-tRNA formyltransferase
MKLVLLTSNTPYARAIIALANHQKIKFEGVVIVERSFSEKARLASVIVKRAGIMGLPYYMQEKHIEEDYLQIKLDTLGYQDIDTYLKHETVCRTVGFNSEETKNAIATFNPDVLVLGQVGLLGYLMLQTPKCGTINGHTALLPDYRGYTDPCHMILEKDHKSIGVSVHFVDEGVDTGKVVATAPYVAEFKPLSVNELLADLRYEAAKLLTKYLQNLEMPQRPKSKLCFLLPIKQRKIAQKMYSELPLDCFK